MLLLLVSCGSKTPPAGETTTVNTDPAVTEPEANTDPVVTEPAETEPDWYTNVPEGKTFDGQTFSILGYYNNNGAWNIYLNPTEQKGEIVNDAAYTRNREVEDMLKITLEEILIDGNAAQEKQFKTSVQADDNAYDLICFWAPGAKTSFIVDGVVGDWHLLKNMDLRADWYNQSANDVYSIGGKQFFAVSDRDSVTVYRMMREFATYDFSYNIDPSGKLTGFAQYSQFNQTKNPDVASWWAKNKEAIQKAYDNLYAQVTE